MHMCLIPSMIGVYVTDKMDFPVIANCVVSRLHLHDVLLVLRLLLHADC